MSQTISSSWAARNKEEGGKAVDGTEGGVVGCGLRSKCSR